MMFSSHGSHVYKSQMKRTRVAEFVARLTCWRYRYADLRNQPCYIFSEEIDIEEAKRRYPNAVMQWPAPPPGAIGRRVGYTVYAPLEVEVDPMAIEVRKPPFAWWRTNYFCVQWCFRIQRLLRAVLGDPRQ